MLWFPLIFDHEGRRTISAPHLDGKLLLGSEAETVKDLLEDLEERGLPGVCIPVDKNSPLLLVHSAQEKHCDSHKDAIIRIVLTFMCLSLCLLKLLQ